MSVFPAAAAADRAALIRTAAELALALLLAGVVGHGVWRLAGPAPTAAPAPPVASAPQSVPASAPGDFDPFFGRGQAAAAASAPEVTLYGTRASGGAPAAILAGPDGRQRSVVPGEEIAPRLRLHTVAGDHVILAGPSGLHRLEFADRGAPAPQTRVGAAPALAVSTASGGGVQAAAGEPVVRGGHPAEAYESALRPQRRDGRIAGYVWRPGRDLDVLAAAGLRPGDVVIRLNGMDFDNPERVQELADEVALRRPVQVEFERGGRRHTVTFTP